VERKSSVKRIACGQQAGSSIKRGGVDSRDQRKKGKNHRLKKGELQKKRSFTDRFHVPKRESLGLQKKQTRGKKRTIWREKKEDFSNPPSRLQTEYRKKKKNKYGIGQKASKMPQWRRRRSGSEEGKGPEEKREHFV